MAFDEANGVVVLFGGRGASRNPADLLNDTWVWDGTEWTQMNPTTSPTARWGHAMVYDKANGYVLLYGGSIGPNNPVGDTWIWDGGDWTRVYPTHTPGGLWGHMMAFDEDEGKTYIMSGYNGNLYILVKSYWDGAASNWVTANTFGTQMADSAAAYDPVRVAHIRFGGAYSSGITPGNIPPGRNVLNTHFECFSDDQETHVSLHNDTLVARRSHTMAYYAARDLMIVFGGVDDSGNYLNDTFHLRHVNVIDQDPADSPSARAEHAMVYDNVHEELVLFGGEESDGTVLADTWVYRVDNASPEIYHTPVTNGINGVAIDIEATVTDFEEDTLTVTLYYRVTGAANYTSATMFADGSTYSATIPSGSVTLDGVEYYIEADDSYSYPAYSGTESDPHEITVTPATGNLTVTIAPQGAIDAGAQWSVDGSNWYSSGQSLTLSIGSYTVQYSSVAGWDTPSNSSVQITSGGSATATGTYVRQTGSLTVTILPQGAIDAGAMWRRAGTATWLSNGTTETGIPTGNYTVEFSTITGWETPSSVAVTITDGGSASTSGTYIRQTGSLLVTIEPQGARDAGGQWRRTGTATWFDSGVTESDLPTGDYNVEFKSIDSWDAPVSVPVTITSGSTASTSGTYTRHTGSLTVTIAPQGAIDAGAQWRRTGTATWYNSGVTESDIPTGDYSVEFKALTGWNTPAAEPVTITNGGNATASSTYVRQTGSLTVTILPQGAIDDGALWRRTGTETWFSSGSTETDIPTGDYTVEFNSISGWDSPSAASVTITNGGNTTSSGTYVRQTGSLTVSIQPQGAIDDGALWRRVGTETWFASGATETDIPTGDYSVEFNTLSGWDSPSPIAVTISSGSTTSESGTYVRHTGSLTVTILPQGAIDDGAQWRRSGTETWFASGATESDIPTGEYTVEYSTITGWDSPVAESVTITNGGNTTTSGTYVRHLGSLTVTILPQGAIDSGAQWRRTETATWYNSGATESSIPTGDYSVEFKAVDGWTSPASQPVTITKDNNTTAEGTYTRQTGTLNVNIAAAGSGGSFSIAGPDDFTAISGQTSNYSASVPTGSYTVTFTDEVNYSVEVAATASPGTAFGASNPSTGTVSDGDVHTITGTYTAVAGSLTVTLGPSGATSDGAAWRRSGTSTWYSSGATETGITAGSYTVEFKDTTNWCWGTPDDVSATITAGQTTSKSGTYWAAGNIYVYTNNQAWVDAGAQWREYGYGVWRDFGTTLYRRPVGNIIIEVKELEGWNETTTATFEIIQCQTIDGLIDIVPPYGDVTVIITPVQARNSGARWTIIGYNNETWMTSGSTLPDVPVGNYTVKFRHIQGWVKPSNIPIEVVPDGVSETGDYTPAVGCIKTYIRPLAARDAGAKWQINNFGGPYNHGQSVCGVAGPTKTVSFITIPNWSKPGPVTVTIVQDETVVIDETYTANAPAASEEDSEESEDILFYQCTPYIKASLSSSIIMDFDGDGVTDISFYRPSDGTWHIYGRKTVVQFGGPDYWPVPGDYDGDGITDFAYYDPETSTWHIKGMPNVTFGAKGDEPVPGDYDGDGITDIAVYRASEQLVIIRDSHDLTSSSKSLAKGSAFAGDFDGDGIDDFASYDYANGRWRHNDVSEFYTGGEEDTPAPADYDGDGVTDYAVFRSIEGLWLFKGGKRIQFGQDGDLPCPGDYNGDGKAEIAVFRPSEGKWYVYGLFELEFGQAGDIPLVSGK